MVPEATMAQRISRAKRAVCDASLNEPERRRPRVSAVGGNSAHGACSGARRPHIRRYAGRLRKAGSRPPCPQAPEEDEQTDGDGSSNQDVLGDWVQRDLLGQLR